MAKIQIKLIKSTIGRVEAHRKTIEALGLKKIGQIVEKEDTPQIRGMIEKVNYLVEVIE
ncbi:50S ribosomal protein L30 [Proteiniborus sp.]|uniref:50S ribosomal protein L30 n=1 Tax=Proteiniborus sp. TaxID=2079015 RepID=UPI0033216832